MAFHASFACLWCGAPHTCRDADDLEGWAQLCPTCLGKAGDNGFLRFRLHEAITARGRASGRGEDAIDVDAPDAAPVAVAVARSVAETAEPSLAGDADDWYLRRGRYAGGAIEDAVWHAELDAAGRWLDGLPIRGQIVELAAGTGWWSPLLAVKGELSLYDADPAPLERARERLVAHGLRAHLHVRDPWAEPDRAVDAVFAGSWLNHVPGPRLGAFLALVHRWLKPGGRVAFVDALTDGPRPRANGTIRTPGELEAALRQAGFATVEVTTSGRFFVLGTATT